MPVAQIRNPAGAFGLPLTAGAGLNDQVLLQVVNNSGTFLQHGDVVVWDNNTALSALTTVSVSGAQTGTLASFTLTAGASTAGYAAVGALIVPGTVTAGGSLVPVFISYTGVAGSTFTGAKAHTATITNGLADAAVIYQAPSSTATGFTALTSWAQFASMVTAPGDAGRYVTLSATGAVKDPLVAGVVSATADAGTFASTPNTSYPNYPILPGQEFLMAVGGIARVRVNTTVTALDLLCTGVTPGCASSGTPTLGNLIGVALEANTAKDANNTIRVALKIG